MSGLSGIRNALLADPNIEGESSRAFYKRELACMFRIGWPLAVSTLCRMLMISMDVLYVGHIGSSKEDLAALLPQTPYSTPFGQALLGGQEHDTKTYMAAVGLSDMLTTVLFVPLMALSMALNPLIGQALGSGRKMLAGTWLQASLFWLTVCYLPVLILFLLVGQILLLLGFDEEVSSLAGTFARISVFWPLPNAWYMSFRNYFQTLGRPMPAMYNSITFVFVNAFLDWLLIFGGPFSHLGWWQGMGFTGAAVAVSSSRVAQVVIYSVTMFLVKRAHREAWPGWTKEFLSRARTRAFFAQAIPQMGTMMLQMGITQCTTLLIAKLGTDAVAASQAAFWGLAPIIFALNMVLAVCTSIRVGFHLGKGEPHLAKCVTGMNYIVGLSFTLFALVFVTAFRHEIVSVLTSSEEARVLAAQIIPARLVGLSGDMVVNIGTGGVLAGQGRTKVSTYLSLFFELPLSLGTVLVLVLIFKVKSVTAVFWAQACSSCVEAVLVFLIVRRSNWEACMVLVQQRQRAAAGGASAPPAPVKGGEEELPRRAPTGNAGQGEAEKPGDAECN